LRALENSMKSLGKIFFVFKSTTTTSVKRKINPFKRKTKPFRSMLEYGENPHFCDLKKNQPFLKQHKANTTILC
jgi:hypothetical protein